MRDVVDYENIWDKVWGDMQKYGPVHRHHRRIFGQMIATLPRAQMRKIADVGCGEGSSLGLVPKARNLKKMVAGQGVF